MGAEGLKNPYGLIVTAPYDPPYNIVSPTAYAGGYGSTPLPGGFYHMSQCNDSSLYGSSPANIGIHLVNVGETENSLGDAQYNGFYAGSICTTIDNLEQNLFDNLIYGIFANNSNIVVRNSVFMNSNNSTVATTGGGIGVYAVRDPSSTNLYRAYIYNEDIPVMFYPSSCWFFDNAEVAEMVALILEVVDPSDHK